MQPNLLINQYRRDLENKVRYGGSRNESSVRKAFSNLLEGYCQAHNFQLVEEITITGKLNKPIRPDGIVKDALRLDWGYWEAKDDKDNLDEEIEIKINQKGYPTDNILFQDNLTAVLIQNGAETLRINMQNDVDLDKIINQFLDFERAEVKDFRTAIATFNNDLPTILDTLRKLIDSQSTSNNNYIQARDKFLKVCQESINPNINIADIREMIIQHILTEDIFTNIFSESQFHSENNIAKQLQEVIKTFFSGDLKRNTLKTIESYYSVIIRTASNIVNHQEKQKFLKVVYENFYKAYNPKAADRLGIVYTPNEIVKFMVESTDYLLGKHFTTKGLSPLSLGDAGIEILDPATGTGTFITEIIDYLLIRDLPYKYKNDIHCNEVAILPYYIANLNIEYSYQQKMGEYLEFKNICLVDTLDHTDKGEKQLDFLTMNLENTERIKKQNDRKISVIIGNPPYNAKQENFNDNNANRKYLSIDKRIKDTYIKEGTAQNQIVVYDMYTRFIRWATDRLNDNGIIAFVSNNSFINAKTYDGFRKVISEEFNEVYIIDLKGNARTSGERRRQEGGNVFSDDIRVGIAIYFLIKNKNKQGCKIYYNAIDDYVKSEEKKQYLSNNSLESLSFERINPDKNNNWIDLTDNDFETLLPLVNKETKLAKNKDDEKAIFKLFSLGLVTARDEWVYDYNMTTLENKVNYLINLYNQDVDFYLINKNEKFNHDFDDSIKWSRAVKKDLIKGIKYKFDSKKILTCFYRPFVTNNLYFDKKLNEMQSQLNQIFSLKKDNIIIAVNVGNKPFNILATDKLPDYHFNGDSQCLPLYTYDKNGDRLDNITDWGLERFREYYNTVEQASSLLKSGNNHRQDACATDDKIITKEDIFYYVYAVLHNPKYREKYELNLKRELPRIPFYEDFWQWVNWGKELMKLHINYETIEPYELKIINVGAISPCLPLPKPKLKADKINGKIIIDEVTTLENVPNIAWEYKLGNRSALEWILDQYKEKKPKDKTIAEKFNNYKFAGYKEQVINLLMRVTTVSVETMKIINLMNN